MTVAKSNAVVEYAEDGSVVIRVVAARPDGDELVPRPGPLEEAAWDRLVKAGTLPAAKIGRRWYARRSDILALVDKLRHEPPVKASGAGAAADLRAIAARARRSA